MMATLMVRTVRTLAMRMIMMRTMSAAATRIMVVGGGGCECGDADGDRGGIGGAGGGDMFASFIPIILIVVIFYFFLIRPQQKKAKKHKNMVEALRRGDQVITQGGLIGKVLKVKDDNEIEVELSEGVKVRVVQSTIAKVITKTEPAAS